MTDLLTCILLLCALFAAVYYMAVRFTDQGRETEGKILRALAEGSVGCGERGGGTARKFGYA